jgi:hypothetical protein
MNDCHFNNISQIYLFLNWYTFSWWFCDDDLKECNSPPPKPILWCSSKVQTCEDHSKPTPIPHFLDNRERKERTASNFKGAKKKQNWKKNTENSEETPQLQQSHAITAMWAFLVFWIKDYKTKFASFELFSHVLYPRLQDQVFDLFLRFASKMTRAS